MAVSPIKFIVNFLDDHTVCHKKYGTTIDCNHYTSYTSTYYRYLYTTNLKVVIAFSSWNN